jgi:hypothetical protein
LVVSNPSNVIIGSGSAFAIHPRSVEYLRNTIAINVSCAPLRGTAPSNRTGSEWDCQGSGWRCRRW